MNHYLYVLVYLRTSTLRKNCRYWLLFWFAFSRIQSDVDQNNSEYGHFSRSATLRTF